MIEIQNLTKDYGSLRAVDGVSFRVGRGEVLGFLGPNGAGKSTTMKMITGFLAPSAGSVKVAGHDVVEEPRAAKARIGYLPEGAPLYPDMTPASFLEFIAAVRGLSGARKAERIQSVVREVHLEGVLQQRIDTLSKGFKRRVGLAQAIVHDPEVLILDEPTDGLDPNQKHEVRSLIQRMAPSKCIVLSTHILEEVEAVCTRAIIVSHGKVRFDGTPEELAARSSRHNVVCLRLRARAPEETLGALRGLSGVARVERQEQTDGGELLHVLPSNGTLVIEEVGALARERRWEVDQLWVQPGRLDEVFREITSAETPGTRS